MNEVENNYLSSLLDEVKVFELYNDELYFIAKSKVDKSFAKFKYVNDIDGWLRNINYLIEQINMSVSIVINLIEKNDNSKHYFRDDTNKKAFYYTENIMFRLTALWDLLAQLCNNVYQLNENSDSISYKSFFKKYSVDTLNKNASLNKLAKSVKDYINENDEDSFNNPWKGNHKYVNELRNSFTHRLNPHIFTFHNASFKKSENEEGGIIFPLPPIYEIKRMLEDYNEVYKYIEKTIKYCSEFIKTEFFIK